MAGFAGSRERLDTDMGRQPDKRTHLRRLVRNGMNTG